MTMKAKSKRRGPQPSAQLSRPDFAYTMRLPDGRTVCIEVPGRWMTEDRDGSPAFLPGAIDFLDRIRALFMSALDRPPSPGYIMRLREALGMTQQQLGDAIGVDSMTVSRWERGTLRPSAESLAGLEKLRKRMVGEGVVIPS